MFYLEKYLFKPIAHFWVACSVCSCCCVVETLYIFCILSLIKSIMWKYFLILRIFKNSSDSFFWQQKNDNFNEVLFIYFSFCYLCVWCLSNKSSVIQWHEAFTTFSSKSFVILVVTFMSLIFCVNFLYGIQWVNLHSLVHGYLVLLAVSVRMTILSSFNGLGTMVQNHLTIYTNVYFVSLFSI